ncbi:dTDP-4-dehydrorhamnose reductase [Vibrio vulnificus]|uniref:dTDP-4-dehydrorhamnose reductase n=2 Tax=Vibrio vulnificus TaxID=672 RepID=UPI000CD2390E|nr:dTDP-4-dehydrorhamnose reductase [Vibrio vulnificus]EGQ9279546.1 dTDP-4-dehydrorhamnose reductase [Vibrio vulnificus]EJV9414808.1 dTDP-4-dehydrorhamnose reductase [Vibrio vulnificus]EKD7163299.1 dTDP-4-dehydrorhamnose reductase [Vibrio vulnificus]EKO5187873.1 dTDP-4-dehydrorhamnose reductase [Vibrio vulnificus]ELH7806361.1 dTDP-4-dehydrorhamnose reductase [Vibrio vulnificus]
MKVLITGCNGQVGHCLTERLKNQAELLALDYEGLDITDREAVFHAVSEFRPNYIINAAAHTAVDRAEQEVELSFAINFDGPRYLAQAAKLCGAVMLHISTDYVFDGMGDKPYQENDSTGPQGVYGQSKLAGEQAVAEACPEHLILRTAWVFGEHGNNFVKTMLRLAQSRDELSIVGDQFGGPTYAGDIADALITMVQYTDQGSKPKWGVYHFSGMPYASWYNFASAIFQAADQHKVLHKKLLLSSIPTSAYPTPAKRPGNSRLDCSKIEAQFGIKPSDWQAALNNIQAYK